MCGRYFIDLSMVRKLTNKLSSGEMPNVKTGDVFPNDEGFLLVEEQGEIVFKKMPWGFPLSKKLLINARSESVLTKPMFSKAITNQRCVIPVRHFYEWDSAKTKVTFSYEDETIMYLAGFYDYFEGKPRFIIMTREANDSVKDVHHRMPLIITESDIPLWLGNTNKYRDIINYVMPKLKKTYNYKQMSFFGDSDEE